MIPRLGLEGNYRISLQFLDKYELLREQKLKLKGKDGSLGIFMEKYYAPLSNLQVVNRKVMEYYYLVRIDIFYLHDASSFLQVCLLVWI